MQTNPIRPFPPLPENPGHVQGHAQGGFVRHSLLFAGWAAFPAQEVLESEATNSYGGLRTFASLGPYRASMDRSVQLMDFITNNWRNF